jgi:hypothetical protein
MRNRNQSSRNQLDVETTGQKEQEKEDMDYVDQNEVQVDGLKSNSKSNS